MAKPDVVSDKEWRPAVLAALRRDGPGKTVSEKIDNGCKPDANLAGTLHERNERCLQDFRNFTNGSS